ncbi:MAG: NAD(P)H-dependent flavin oxidoreductase [Betaproteobacteria bacterium]
MFDFRILRFALIQAPMAGGINTPALAAAVCQSGAVGSFGFAYSTPERIADDLAQTQALTSGPINANFFVFNPVEPPDLSAVDAALEAIRALPIAAECPVSAPRAPFFPALDEQLGPVWQHRPAMLTFHFGIPAPGIIDRAHDLGMAVGITATCLEEAHAIEQAGADFIIAQGIEAGGHRGLFNPEAPDQKLACLPLAALLSHECSVPIVAAGGIMRGADIRAALSAGASAVQLGTAFLCCDESGASPEHKAFVLSKSERESVFTRAFSGRPARGIDNAFIRRMEAKPVLPFPLQNTLTAPLRKLATQRGDGEYQSLWAGTAYRQAQSLPAQALISLLAREFEESSANPGRA